MKYLKLYENFMLIKEAIANKKLILLSGPSASGKSYLAENTLGAMHWYKGDTSVALIGTDNFFNDKKIFSKFSKLLKKFGCPELSKFKEHWHWILEEYIDHIKKWHEVSSDEEKKKY
jgi:uridine kinase